MLSREEVQRREQRSRTDIEVPEAATAPAIRRPARIPPRLTAEEIAEVNKTKPTRLPPLLFESPHEAAPSFHEDWTIVPGSRYDPEAWEMELRLRDVRNKMIREQLAEGRAVFYKSSGNSMWPLVPSGDACTYHPIQTVTAMDANIKPTKEASELGVGDIVFCQVQRSQLLQWLQQLSRWSMTTTPRSRSTGSETLSRGWMAGSSGSTCLASSWMSRVSGRGGTTSPHSPKACTSSCNSPGEGLPLEPVGLQSLRPFVGPSLMAETVELSSG